MSVPVKQEYVEHNDGSNDGESDDEDGIDGIFDFVNSSVKNKIMKKFKKKMALVEENSRKELDEMIVIHKRLASDLDQKHNQEILELSKKHAEANVKMTDKHEREREVPLVFSRMPILSYVFTTPRHPRNAYSLLLAAIFGSLTPVDCHSGRFVATALLSPPPPHPDGWMPPADADSGMTPMPPLFRTGLCVENHRRPCNAPRYH